LVTQLRNVIFWCHLASGLVAGVVILIMSVTGVLLTYEKQIAGWADTRDYRVAPPSPEARRLPVEELLAGLRQTEPAPPTGVTVRADPTEPVAVAFAGGRTVFLDPYTGRVLGGGATAVRGFFRTMTDWHRWLGTQGDGRAVGKAITGACNLAFLFLVASGLYLWWPRNWAWKAVRSVTWFRRGLSGKARDFNWHNVIGFWSLVPLFFVVLSAVVISYTWASNLVYRVAGEEPPPPRGAPGPPGGPGRSAESERVEVPLEGLDRLLARAEQQVAGWRSISLQLPAAADAPVTFTIDEGTGGQPHKRAQLTLARDTGEVVRWEPFSSYTLGRQLRSILRFAHTGEVAGLAGQTVAGIASAGGAVLVWTGLALAWRRFRAWVARRRSRGRVTAPATSRERAPDPAQ
jgi:uncharacterized iron-regulated membrane protein